MVFPAFIDTNVLFGAYLCDTMLCLAEAGTCRPLWSAGVMDELERNLLERGLPSEAITHRLAEMTSAFPDAQVTGYEALIERMACDPKDKHVLAAAVRANAEVLVTFNDKHFPELATAPYDIAVGGMRCGSEQAPADLGSEKVGLPPPGLSAAADDAGGVGRAHRHRRGHRHASNQGGIRDAGGWCR